MRAVLSGELRSAARRARSERGCRALVAGAAPHSRKVLTLAAEQIDSGEDAPNPASLRRGVRKTRRGLMPDFLTTNARERGNDWNAAVHVRRRAQAAGRGAPRRHGAPSSPRSGRPPGDPLRVIAEINRASPRLVLKSGEFDPPAIRIIYERVGAAAISVLTEPLRFQGSGEHLRAVRDSMTVPVLLKALSWSTSVHFLRGARDTARPSLIVSLGRGGSSGTSCPRP